MLMYPDVLPSADIDADSIVANWCVHPSVPLYMGFGLCIVSESLWRHVAAIEYDLGSLFSHLIILKSILCHFQ